MPKVLVACELSDGSNPIHILVPLIKGLVRKGFEPVLALRRIQEHGLLTGLDCKIIQAPFFTANKKRIIYTFADLLDLKGWSDPDFLELMTRAWRLILKAESPDIVVGFHSPGLNMAARGLMPALSLGDGFHLPPPQSPLPVHVPGKKKVPPASLEAEKQATTSMNHVCQTLGIPAPANLGQLLQADKAFVTGLAFLDPFASKRKEPRVWGFDHRQLKEVAASKGRGGYLVILHSQDKRARPIMDFLIRKSIPCQAFLPGIGPKSRQHLGQRGVKLLSQPPLTFQDLAAYRGLIHHGGLLGELAAAAGLPQVLLPTDPAQAVQARLTQDAGLGLSIPRTQSRLAEAVAEKLKDFFFQGRYPQKAREMARCLRERSPRPTAEVVPHECLKMLA
ncbi:MAG: hypothetical protein PVG03_08105 [Desulfarculaceae bacterium]